MKLLTQSTIYLILTSLVVFLVSGILVLFLMQNLIRSEIDDDLIDAKWEFIWELERAKGFESIEINGDDVKIGRKLSPQETFTPVFKDTSIIFFGEDEGEPFRALLFAASHQNDTRIVTLYHSFVETEDLATAILISLLSIFFIMIAAIAALNFYGMRHIWKPFKAILNHIKIFDFRQTGKFNSTETTINEFKELNRALALMTEKLKKDYLSVKEFSENASHEMQTPLAIIQSKLELLFQKEDLGEENIKAINSAYQATIRLSKLHSELNLLTRIENHEFKNFETINLKDLLGNQIENFADIFQHKNIDLRFDLTENPEIQGNYYLLETLSSNLFSNAIKHNLAVDGKIIIQLSTKYFTISNPGQKTNIAPSNLFERFKKGQSASSTSTGLGLAIAKQICVYHNFEISYNYKQNLHTFIVKF